MLVGNPTASYIYFMLPADGGMLPSDLDGLNPPPPGSPNYIAEFTATLFGDPADGMKIFNFHADFLNPSASTLTLRPESPIAVAAFDPRTSGGRNVWRLQIHDEQPPVWGQVGFFIEAAFHQFQAQRLEVPRRHDHPVGARLRRTRRQRVVLQGERVDRQPSLERCGKGERHGRHAGNLPH